MSVRFQLFDDKEQTAAKVSPLGEIIVAPLSYSEPHYMLVDSAGVETEILPARGGEHFILTSIIVATSKTFGSATTAETVTIYEAAPNDISVNLKTVMKLDMLKNDRVVATGLNTRLSASRAIVAIATDNDVDITLGGYYIPEQ